jgi:hypothetical protein
MKCNSKKKKKKKKRGEQSGPAALLASPYHPSPLGPTRSFVVGFYPRRWVLPLRRWVLPFVVGPYHSSLGLTLRRWALPFIAVFYALRR